MTILELRHFIIYFEHTLDISLDRDDQKYNFHMHTHTTHICTRHTSQHTPTYLSSQNMLHNITHISFDLMDRNHLVYTIFLLLLRDM